MKRFAAQWVYCNPQQIISKGVVEIDEKGFVKAVFSLNQLSVESYSTTFYNGIIIPALLDNEIITSKSEQFVWDVLQNEFQKKREQIKVGEPVTLYLLEPVDLVKLQFLAQSKIHRL